MRYDATTRRLFLSGAGALLALPALESLLPRTARAQTSSPLRYIQVLNPYGPNQRLFFGQRSPTTQSVTTAGQTFSAAVEDLTDVQGAISTLVGSEFNPYKSKLSLLRGVDVLSRNNNHNFCFATCASSYGAGVDGDEVPPYAGQVSVDTLIAESDQVYDPSHPADRRVVNLNPVTTCSYSTNRSFSWQRKAAGDGVEMTRPMKTTTAFRGLFSFEDATTAPDPREATLIQAVYDDYRAVRDGQRISAADKARLEAYMQLIDDLDFGAVMSCEEPMLPHPVEEGTDEERVENQLRLLAAAMACDLTRVASITLGTGFGYGTNHERHHKVFDNGQYNVPPEPFVDDLIRVGRWVAELIGLLDGIELTGGGTLLDASIVYWSMQYGCAIIEDQHKPKDMPVLVAGGANSQLAQGRYIDYRASDGGSGIALNNLLVTFMGCMGLGSSDYEMSPGSGYGDYIDGAFDARPNGAFWESAEGRRSALPFLFAGQPLG